MNVRTRIVKVKRVESRAGQMLGCTSFWEELKPKEKRLIKDNLSIRHFEKNQIIISGDSSCIGIAFVINGGMRVSLISDKGREVTLWRLGPGDCCVTTASCVISQITFDALVTAEEETELMVIPSPICSSLQETNIYFRAFIYEIETERFSSAIWAIQEILFKRLDQRLATYLLAEYERTGSADLELTQEEVAREVNSAREAITRMLHHFSAEGLVEIGRGHIKLKNVPELRKLI